MMRLWRVSVPLGVSLGGADLYAVSYRPVQRAGQPSLDMWQTAVEVGRSLPTMPLWLRGNLCFPVDLNATYARTCREQRIMANGT